MIVNDELDGDSLKTFEQEYKEFCLELKLSKKFPQKINAFSKPRFRQILKLLALAYRSKKYEKSVTSRNKIPFIDFFSPVKAKQIYGVPMGGIGTGTIGRSYTGEFTR
ncbi:non-lysosomal glucosylceramidase-like, partial [Brachionus plicatilis]